jgi:ankyrin repeat protein
MSKMRAVVLALLMGAFAAPAVAQSSGFGSDSYRFFKAVREKDGPAAQALMSQPGSTLVNQRDYDSGETALIIVTKRRDSGWMSLLLNRGANVDAKDRAGSTPLIAAAELGFSDGVQLLLARKANPNLSNNSGETALIKAVQRRDANSVRALLAAGANPDITDNISGLSARDYAEQDRRAGLIARMIKDADEKKKAGAGTGAQPAGN